MAKQFAEESKNDGSDESIDLPMMCFYFFRVILFASNSFFFFVLVIFLSCIILAMFVRLKRTNNRSQTRALPRRACAGFPP